MCGEEVFVIGETLFDFYPIEESPNGPTYQSRLGGAPANVAVGLSRLGHAPAFWTRIGDDPLGVRAHDRLCSFGITDAYIEQDSTEPTSLAFVETNDDSFHFYRAADTRLHPDRLPVAVLSETTWMAVGGVSLSVSPAREAQTEAMRLASDRGVSVLLDPNYRAELWGDRDFRSTIRARLPLIDVLSATEDELARIIPEPRSVEGRIERILEAGPHTVCLTAGAAGARLCSDSDAPWGKTDVELPAFSVEAIDTVGAGDALTAGLLASMLDGPTDPETHLRYGIAVAALSTTARGAMSALPTATEVESFLAERS